MVVGKTIALLTALCLVAAAAGTVAAQTVPSQPGGKTAGRISYFDRVDTNKDGFIDRAEYRAGLEKLFDYKDKNKDGVLSLDELKTRRGDPAKRLARFDTDKNGSISRAEFMANADQRFARCDKNGDGLLARGECGGRRAPAGGTAPVKQ